MRAHQSVRLACGSLIAIFLLAVSSLPSAAQRPFDHDAVAREAEDALRVAFSHWSYDRDWMLWDMGTQATKRSVPRELVVQRMTGCRFRPAVQRPIEDVVVEVLNEQAVTIHARVNLEARYGSATRWYSRTFNLRKEENQWRIGLPDIVGLIH